MMFTRGKLAKETNCNIETIRYYENIGILPAPKRAENGYRLYDEEHLKLLRFIQRAKELGFDPSAIRSLIQFSSEASDYTRAEVKSLTQDHIAQITQKIRDLNKLKKTLVGMSENCDGAHESAADCPIINSMQNNR